jgi:hypothetical protein
VVKASTILSLPHSPVNLHNLTRLLLSFGQFTKAIDCYARFMPATMVSVSLFLRSVVCLEYAVNLLMIAGDDFSNYPEKDCRRILKFLDMAYEGNGKQCRVDWLISNRISENW